MLIFLIFCSALLATGNNVLNKVFARSSSVLLHPNFVQLLGNSIFACIVFTLLSGFKLAMNPILLRYSLYFGIICTVSCVLHFFTAKFSPLTSMAIFSSLGNVILPVVLGNIIYGDKFTVQIIASLVLLLISICIPPIAENIKENKIKNRKIGIVLCFSLFFFNGFVALYSKHTALIPAVSDNTASYYLYTNIFMLTATVILGAFTTAKKSAIKDFSVKTRIKRLFFGLSPIHIAIMLSVTLCSNIGSVISMEILSQDISISAYTLTKSCGMLIFTLPATVLIFKEKPKISDLLSLFFAIAALIAFFI